MKIDLIVIQDLLLPRDLKQTDVHSAASRERALRRGGPAKEAKVRGARPFTVPWNQGPVLESRM